ncbi:hypothetical protein [Thiomicrorhabdus sp.]|uniref:hypothetical protein n=1 Tax=Thiomicrorhabdus sp. TaxID=2039724 RepID=UPI0029C99A4D|nr:hypothetical protein [Thiomicrorhabdus sp.]
MKHQQTILPKLFSSAALIAAMVVQSAYASDLEACLMKYQNNVCGLLSMQQFQKLVPADSKDIQFTQEDGEEEEGQGRSCTFSQDMSAMMNSSQPQNYMEMLAKIQSGVAVVVDLSKIDKSGFSELPQKWQQRLSGKSNKELFYFMADPKQRDELFSDMANETMQKEGGQMSAEERQMYQSMMQQLKNMPKREAAMQKVSGYGDAAVWAYQGKLDQQGQVSFMGMMSPPQGELSVLQGDYILGIKIKHSQPEKQKDWAESVLRQVLKNCQK